MSQLRTETGQGLGIEDPVGRFFGVVAQPRTYLNVLLMILSLGFGIVNFTAVATLILGSLWLTFAPALYSPGAAGLELAAWRIDSLPEAILVSLVGIVAFVLSLHLLNYLARVELSLARFVLSQLRDL